MPVLEPGVPTLLCDLGAGIDDLPAHVAVIDHHAPAATGRGPVLNPHLDGLDGERVLATAALAHGFANRLADCRDLAGLAAAGVIGDGQAFEAENAEAPERGIANGVLEVERGLAPGATPIAEKLELAIDPMPPGNLRGCNRVRELLRASLGEDGPALDLLPRSSCSTRPGRRRRARSNRSGATGCSRRARPSVMPRTLAAVVDACGKAGRGGLAASVCLRAPGAASEARAVATDYRRRVIGAIAAAVPVEEAAIAFGSMTHGSQAMSRPRSPVRSAGRSWSRPGRTAASGSARGDGTVPLGPLLRRLAGEVGGGTGGGHARRAGAVVPADAFPAVAAAFAEAVGP